MLGNERVSHVASLAKYAVAFWNVALFGHPGLLALQLANLGVLADIAGHYLRKLTRPCILRVLTDPELLRHLRHRILALGDLGHSITLELIAEIGLPHHRLLS